MRLDRDVESGRTSESHQTSRWAISGPLALALGVATVTGGAPDAQASMAYGPDRSASQADSAAGSLSWQRTFEPGHRRAPGPPPQRERAQRRPAPVSLRMWSQQ